MFLLFLSSVWFLVVLLDLHVQILASGLSIFGILLANKIKTINLFLGMSTWAKHLSLRPFPLAVQNVESSSTLIWSVTLCPSCWDALVFPALPSELGAQDESGGSYLSARACMQLGPFWKNSDTCCQKRGSGGSWLPLVLRRECRPVGSPRTQPATHTNMSHFTLT